jgi:hypothetical protein
VRLVVWADGLGWAVGGDFGGKVLGCADGGDVGAGRWEGGEESGVGLIF